MNPADATRGAGQDNPAGKTSAAEKTLLVLEAIVQQPRFSGIVASTGLAKATVHRILAVLCARGFVVMTADGSYLPGPTIMALAGQGSRANRILEIAEPQVSMLVDAVGCTVHLGSLSRDRMVYAIKAEAKNKPYQMPSRVGTDVPLHSSAIGKTVLATLPADQLAEYLRDPGLTSRTVRTITSPEAMRIELEAVRQRGYALDNEENVPGIICVAAPVHDHLGRVRHAVSVSTITLEHTLSEVEAMAPQVIQCARRISDALGYLPPPDLPGNRP